jgi:hypothetical protein
MGRAIDLFVTYRFLKILTTPFDKQEAFKLGIIDKDGNRVIPQTPGFSKKTKAPPLETSEEKEAYTILHKLIFNIKKLFNKVPGLRTKVGTYAAALYLLKDTFKESVDDPDMFEKEFMKYLKEDGIVLDDSFSESVIGFGELLPKGQYSLVQDILNKEEEELTAKTGDVVIAYEDQSPIDTILGVEIFPVVHKKSGSVIYVGLEDIK